MKEELEPMPDFNKMEEEAVIEEGPPPFGECRRFPPTIGPDGETVFPVTAGDPETGCWECKKIQPGSGNLCTNCKCWDIVNPEELEYGIPVPVLEEEPEEEE